MGIEIMDVTAPKVKLTKPQLAFLKVVAGSATGTYAHPNYAPVKKLMTLGFIRPRDFGSSRTYFVTDLGRQVLTEQKG